MTTVVQTAMAAEQSSGRKRLTIGVHGEASELQRNRLRESTSKKAVTTTPTISEAMWSTLTPQVRLSVVTHACSQHKRSNPLQTAGPTKAFLKAASADAEEPASADDESSSADAGDATQAVAGAGAGGAGTAPAAAASAGGADAPGGDNDPSTDLSHRNGKKRKVFIHPRRYPQFQNQARYVLWHLKA